MIAEFSSSGKLPQQQHSARINVHGPPTPRKPMKVKTTEGNSLALYCPMGGYPLEKMIWKKDGTLYYSNSRNIEFESIKVGFFYELN